MDIKKTRMDKENKFMRTPKIMFSKFSEDPLIIAATDEIKKIFEGDKTKLPKSCSLGKLSRRYYRQVFPNGEFIMMCKSPIYKPTIKGLFNKETNEFHQLCYLFNTLLQNTPNEFNIDINSIKEIIYYDNPDYIVYLVNKENKKILIHLELTSTDKSREKKAKIRRIVDNHLKPKKIIESCNYIYAPYNEIQFDSYYHLIFTSNKDYSSADHLIYDYEDGGKTINIIEAETNKKAKDLFKQLSVDKKWKIIVRAFVRKK